MATSKNESDKNILPVMTNDLSWEIIQKYFDDNLLVNHQLESYNDFVLRKIDEIIEGFNPIEIHHQFMPEHDKFKFLMSIYMSNPVLSRPMIYEKDGSTKIMTPNDARLRNFSYSASLNVDIEIKTMSWDEEQDDYILETKKLNNINLGKIPVMVNSRYCVNHNNYDMRNINHCRYDAGGYFIINGNEKVIISQDRICENKTHVFVNNKQTAYSLVAEIRSVAENKFGVPKTTSLKMSAKASQYGRYIRVNIHHIKQDIPLFVLFKALGIENDKEIVEYIVHNTDKEDNQAIMNELIGTIDEATGITCARDALEYLSKYLHINGYPKEILNNKPHRLNILRSILEKEFLPHVGTDFKKKALYLGYMTNKLIGCHLGIYEMDDRDSYINKRVDTPGVLLANLFRQYFGKMVKDMRNMIQKELNTGSWKALGKFNNLINKVNVYKIIKSTVVESGLKYALATGNWGIKNNKNKQGVAQVLNRMTYNSTLSHLRRINTPIEKTGKLVLPRKLHSTQWGFICPAECFDPDTPILLWNGIIKKARDIVVGDYLIDDKGNPTRVKSTCSGFKDMYEVVPDKRNFMNHTVTDNHILTLKARNHTRNPTKSNPLHKFRWFDKDSLSYKSKSFHSKEDMEQFKSNIDDVIDITIEKYLTLPSSVQTQLYLFKSDGINWEHKEVALDPYILGMWLGDGSKCGYEFATADKELLGKWIEWGKDNDATITKGFKYKYTISSTINNAHKEVSGQKNGYKKTEKGPLKKLLTQYNLIHNKHIPLDYLVNDRTTRLALLAGLIDTDGHVRANGHEIRICQGERNYKILYDAEFLARSLGFSCHVSDGICTYSVNGEKRQRPYKELAITGANLYEIPTVLPRKKLNRFDNPTSIKKCSSYLQSPFNLVSIDVQPFVGWQVEGNGRFLLGDMTTVHNTPEGSAIGLVKNMSVATNITISSNTSTVREILNEPDSSIVYFENGNVEIFDDAVKVIVNGDVIGICNNPVYLYAKLKQAKRSGAVNVCTGVVWNIHRNEIHVNTEGGRCIRPLFVVDEKTNRLKFWEFLENCDGKKYTWTDLVLNGVIEFIDVEETNFITIAVKEKDLTRGDKGTHKQPKYTHMEIHPSIILGVLAGSIPFSDHNQAPRNTYQCLDPNETVLLENGQKVALKNVRIGDRVITFDPSTKLPKSSKVVHQYVRPTDKKIYEITTVSGRKIIATENHPFMTNEGWKRVEDFGDDTKIGIFMNPEPVSVKVSRDDLVFHKYVFSNRLEQQWGMEHTVAEAFEKEMCRLDMFPMELSDKRMPTWSRIIGKVYSSATMNMIGTMDMHVVFPSREDADAFERDVEYLGFDNKGKCEISGDGSVKMTYRESAFVCSVMVLCDKFQVPVWVERGSLMMKREFLAGFLGGDGSGPSVEFLKQLRGLSNEFGIPELTDDTMEQYFDQIGWRYNIKKTMDIGKVVEYIKTRRHMPEDHKLVSDYDHWNDTVEIEGYGLFLPIASMKEVENRNIADITVEDENHSFIAGSNFMSSNSAMAKQAIGVYASNFRHRFDTMAHVLNYPQKPIVQTNISRLIYANEMPRGINAMVAIMTYTGFNQEDSVILNKSAIDRGLFTSTFYRTYKEQCNKNHSNGEEEFFIKPNPQATKGIKPFNYDKLSDDGFVPENTFVDSGDIIIGKCMPQKVDSVIVHKDTSISLKNNETGYIDKNCHGEKYFTAVNGDGYNFTKVRIRNTRVPTIGDKFSSYSAQKGTLGMYYGQEEMPFTKDGMVPDIIMNPHAIPSRMTISQLMECLMGKACTLKGSYGDATPFTDLSVEDVADELQAQGMERYGNEILYDPRTGEQIQTLVFFGPTFYQRLKHMTADKQHSRAANGPLVNLTRQPAEGRAREGGLRIGEMEVECNLAHGISSFLKERLVEMSDNYRIFTCKKCGLIANCNPEKDLWLCKSCKNTTQFAEFRIPYAAKLLMQELATMSIGMRFMAAN